MLLKPKKTKYIKSQRGRLSRTETSFSCGKFGKYALIALESAFLSARQIESTRQVINRCLKRKGKIWIRVFPDFPMTAKPTEVRMGKGKGAVKTWFARIRKGKVLFEVDGVPSLKAKEALITAKKKLPFKALFFESSWKINKKV
jgi:large subunit ribosomal protein L16